MLKPMIPYENSANTFGIDPFILTQIIGTKRDPERDNLAQARIQVFLGARTPPPPLRLSAIFFLYSNPQMLIFPCPLNFIVVFSLPNYLPSILISD